MTDSPRQEESTDTSQAVEPKDRFKSITVQNLPSAENIKLDDVQRHHAISMFAGGCPLRDITDDLFLRFHIKAYERDLKEYFKLEANQPLIRSLREKYLTQVKDVPLANKRIRMDDIQHMRDKLLEMVDSLHITKKTDRSELLMIFRRWNEILCVAREEMEGKSGAYQQVNITELSSLSDEELQRRKHIIIAKATGTYAETAFGTDEAAEGTGRKDSPESSEVPVASPEELQRDRLQ